MNHRPSVSPASPVSSVSSISPVSVVERFLRYVRFDTQSAEGVDTYPSTAKQKDLGRQLVAELRDLGVLDAAIDEHGYVTGTVESNVNAKVPVVGLIAHVDTSPEVSGADVRPQLHPCYDGGPIALDSEVTLTPEMSPALLAHKGHTIITASGTTLLGADDKAGIAEIMTAVERLRADQSIPHGRIRIAFTCDEEVGCGTKHFDVKQFGADCAYTVDGENAGEIENETFCADSATVTFAGISVHPGFAKGKLVNAAKVAARFIGLLPGDMTPETTEDRQGYIHPISVSGGCEKAVVKLILRDFEEAGLVAQHKIVAELAEQARREFPGSKVTVAGEQSYRNMRYVLDQHPQTVEYALEAVRRAGIEPKLAIIRGGTDGARLSYQGLPTPNVFTGGHLFHSRLEWIAVEDMVAAVDTLVQLVRVWYEKSV
ncbi:MAG: peptidase T [Pseudomonadota bacterium]